MAYNRFRWWTKGERIKHSPLPKHFPLYQRIMNGDFEISYMIKEAFDEEAKYHKLWNSLNTEYKGDTAAGRYEYVRDRVALQNVRVNKLKEESHKKDTEILLKLRRELSDCFGVDLWEDAIFNIDGDTIELYNFYKKHARNQD